MRFDRFYKKFLVKIYRFTSLDAEQPQQQGCTGLEICENEQGTNVIYKSGRVLRNPMQGGPATGDDHPCARLQTQIMSIEARSTGDGSGVCSGRLFCVQVDGDDKSVKTQYFSENKNKNHSDE